MSETTPHGIDGAEGSTPPETTEATVELAEAIWEAFRASPFFSILPRDAESIARTVLASDWLDAVRRKAGEEERANWSSWLDSWISAVGPTPPTVESVADALRAGPRPFGVAREDR